MNRRRSGLRSTAAALLALCSVLALGLTPQTAHASAPTVVSLTFDDGYTTHWTEAAPMLERHGLRATFYVNTARIDRSGRLTTDEVRQLADAGHEIGGHTLDHARLTDVTADERRRQVCDDRDTLRGLGLPATTFAAPFGASDADTMREIASCGYTAARDVGGLVDCDGCPPAETLPPRDAYAIRTPSSVGEGTTVAGLKAMVRGAETAGGWLPLVFHHICDPCEGNAGTKAIAPRDLERFLAWLAAREGRGTVVATVADALARGGGS
ncbi:polysaccharide deacetylase family protein [Streptomyces sp. RFCAC02]|uniref:polysaccharide deacetylase family protein n=1 Tax=Streptomyces sp. RFCAC02 TaxID=2499143 RepID=UPI00143DEFFF|nr:polysaccharide deacetylase family protein [Streptomyces sp. RFCAC02]